MDQMKKIILTSLGVALIAFLIGGGTYAYFSDVETATNNNFTAGTLNLQVGDEDPCTENVSIGDLKPGDTGTCDGWLLQNTGSINGVFNVSVGSLTEYDGISTEPEQEAEGGASVGLGSKLNVTFWIDADNSGVWSDGDQYLKNGGTVVGFTSGDGSDLPVDAYDTLSSYVSGTNHWDNIKTASAGSDFGYFRISYDLPSSVGNEVQGDSCKFDITFRLKQSQP